MTDQPETPDREANWLFAELETEWFAMSQADRDAWSAGYAKGRRDPRPAASPAGGDGK